MTTVKCADCGGKLKSAEMSKWCSRCRPFQCRDHMALIAWVKGHKKEARARAGYSQTPITDGMEADRWDALAALLEAQQWRPIATAPKDGTWVLIFGPLCKAEAAAFDTTHYRDWIDRHGFTVIPTHWQPLPPPPTEEPSR